MNKTLNNLIVSYLKIILIFLVAYCSSCQQQEKKDKKNAVLVSIEPQYFFVKRIAGERLSVSVLVPPGGNPHAFEPTPKQMLNAADSDLWFRIGEPFEIKAAQVLKSHHPHMIIIDTRDGLDLISLNGHRCCSGCHAAHSDDNDTHVWLSPRLAKIQAKTIANALINCYPQYQSEFEVGFQQLITELDLLDKELQALFANQRSKTLLVSHPAFGYLCRDYGLNQLSIEFEGKDPSPQQLTLLLKTARNENIKRVFTQEQYQNKGAILIAKELDAEIYSVDPYSRNYLTNFREMARLFADAKCDPH